MWSSRPGTAAAEAEQLRAWEREIEVLKAAFRRLEEIAREWWLLLEAPLLRLGKRLDAVLLLPGVVGVIEFKIGASAYASQDRVQTERYAQSLRDFHSASQRRLIFPILCSEQAPSVPQPVEVVEGVASLVLANVTTLVDALRLIAERTPIWMRSTL